MRSGLDTAEAGTGFDPASQVLSTQSDMAGFAPRDVLTHPPKEDALKVTDDLPRETSSKSRKARSKTRGFQSATVCTQSRSGPGDAQAGGEYGLADCDKFR